MKSFQKLSMEHSFSTRHACLTLIERLVIVMIAIITNSSISVNAILSD